MRLLHLYTPLLAIAAVGVFFSNLPLYLFDSGLLNVPPLWWIAALGAFAALLLPQYAHRLEIPVGPLVYWCLFYLAISFAWFAADPASEAAGIELRRRLVAIGYLGIVWLVLQQPGALTVARWATLAATLLGVAMNLYEFFHPGTFSVVTGRAAGLYLNPNISGAALVLGMLVSSRLLPPALQVGTVLLIEAGILATFSRAALLGGLLFGASILVAPIRKLGVGRSLALIVAGIALSAALVGLSLISQRSELEPLRMEVITDRLGMFNPHGHEDTSSKERAELIEDALQVADQHLIVGAGLGSNRFLERKSGSHNQYLDHMAQHGLIGALILPLLAMALVLGAPIDARSDARRFALFLLFWGLFSHNILDELYLLTAVAIQATHGTKEGESPSARNEH